MLTITDSLIKYLCEIHGSIKSVNEWLDAANSYLFGRTPREAGDKETRSMLEISGHIIPT